MSNVKEKSKSVAMLGLFSAIVVVLQLLSYFVKIGTFNLSLVLIPIVLGAVMYGPSFGAILGGVFGTVVAIAAVTGLDAGAFVLFTASPVLLILLCLVKGIAAGAVAGLVAALLKKKSPYGAVIGAAILAPIVNTGIFCLSMVLFFKDTLLTWANGTATVYYLFVGLIGVNFLIEMAINVIFAPAVFSVTKALKKAR